MRKLCRTFLRGGEARCNGGGYDGCACGPYTVEDLAVDRAIFDARAKNRTKYALEVRILLETGDKVLADRTARKILDQLKDCNIVASEVYTYDSGE